MDAKPLVSIVVRTYNRPERLKECLGFLCRQDYRPIQIIIVNDAGQDVKELVEESVGDVPFRYISNERNLGRTAGLNIGIDASEGEYINFVDDDDAVYPHHIRTLTDAAAPDGLPVVYGDVLNVTFERDRQTQEWKRVREQLIYSFDFERDNFLLANYIPLTCLLFRRDCFDAVGPFDESLLIYEDWEFLIRLSRKFPFQHVRTITGEYRRRDDNSNLLEQDTYRANDRVVKRRYRDDRDAAFDEIFKRTFKQQRDLRERMAQFDRVLQQTNQLQYQLAEAHKVIAQLQQEIVRLRTERTP